MTFRFAAPPAHSAVDLARALELPPPTEEQRAVIEADPDVPVLVVAGAGSGKTETMASRVTWLVANGYAMPEEVLGLTFTRKAAGELAERVTRRLARLRAEGLWTPADGSLLASAPTVSTYHAYAGRLVGEHGLLLGREPETRLLTEAAAWQLAHEAVVGFDGPMEAVDAAESTVTAAVVDLAGEMAEHLLTHAEVQEALQAAVAAIEAVPRGEGHRLRAHPGRNHVEALRLRSAVLPIVARYAELKAAREAMDFSDQMAFAARLATRFPVVGERERARYRAVLLDEFQDTSEAQLLLLAGLFRSAEGGSGSGPVPVTAVGDPHQSIYGWRGASAATLARFREAFAAPDPVAVLPLATSWRNDEGVLRLANAVVEPLAARAPVAVPPLRSRPGSGPGTVQVARTVSIAEEARLVARWVARERRGGRHTAAVLCRKRSLFAPVIEALEAEGVPHEVVGLGGLLLTPEVVDLVALLHVVADPARGDHLLRLLTGPRCRLGIADLDGLAAWSRHLLDRRNGPAARLDLAADSSAEPSIVEALDDLPPLGWRGPDGQRVGERAHERLAELASVVGRLRSLTGLPLADLVGEAERALGLDIEVLARPEYSPAAARAHLDAFADVAAQFSLQSDRPTLGGFLTWVQAAIDEERGLERVVAEVRADAVQVLTVHAAKGLEWDVVAVPGLVEATFPAHDVRPVSTSGRWTSAEPTHKGWLAGLSEAGVPYSLRGDRAGLPVFDPAGCSDWPALAAHTEEFLVDVGAHLLREERRLAYVAVTRARRSLLLSAHVWGSQRAPRVTSRFLLAAVGADDSYAVPPVREGVRVLEWAPFPVPGESERPEAPEGLVLSWPVDHLRERRPAAARAAAAVRSFTEQGRAPQAGRWSELVDLLLAERDADPRAQEVPAPGHLRTSDLVALAQDPDRFVLDLRRPMPQPPAVAARRGTAFHAWVESHYARAAMVDVLELPGSADEDPAPDDLLPELQQRFLASEWAARTPVEIETAVETVLDGIPVRGRVDAVFADEDGGFTIVDWKTGAAPTGAQAEARALQLAAYRLAWARLRGLAPSRVRAAFFYARTGETVRPDLVAEADLLALLGALG